MKAIGLCCACAFALAAGGLAGQVFMRTGTSVASVSCGAQSDTPLESSTAQEPVPPSRALRSHGETQLRAMLRDRPQMALFIQQGDLLWEWAVSHFAGDGLSHVIYWNPEAPPPGIRSTYSPSETCIRIERLERLPMTRAFESLWIRAVYEILNATHGADFIDVDNEALAGRVGRAEFVRINVRLEFDTVTRTAFFYRTIWKPWAKHANAPATAELWFDQWLDRSVEEWSKEWNRHGGDPLGAYYARDYDNRVLPSIVSRGLSVPAR